MAHRWKRRSTQGNRHHTHARTKPRRLAKCSSTGRSQGEISGRKAINSRDRCCCDALNHWSGGAGGWMAVNTSHCFLLLLHFVGDDKPQHASCTGRDSPRYPHALPCPLCFLLFYARGFWWVIALEYSWNSIDYSFHQHSLLTI